MTRSSFLETVKQSTASQPKSPSSNGSVLATKEKTSSVLARETIERSPVYAPAPLDPVPQQKFQITEVELRKLGASAAQPMESITRQILASVKGSGDDPISTQVNGIIKTLKGLNPEQMGKGNFLSKLFGRARNIIEDMKAELSTAEQQMDVMSKEVHNGIKKAEKRKQELEIMYEQNNAYGLNLDREYQVGIGYLEQLNTEKDTLIAQGESQNAAEVQKLVDICEHELAEIKAFRLMAANNEPKIKGMILTVDNLIRAGDNVITKMMPVYMINFAQYIISLESKNSAATLNNVHESFNAGLQEGSNLAQENLVETAKLQNKQSVTIETMRVMHENMLKGLDELDKIAVEARTSRVAYVAELQGMEKELSEKLSKV